MVDRPARLSPGELARLLGDGWDAPALGGAVGGALGGALGGTSGAAAEAPPAPAGPPTAEAVWEALEGVPDPEVPVISVVELGIVRGVAVDGGRVLVTITPTYSGCPAMREIERDVLAALGARGWEARVRTTYAPAWTTDWMTDAAREKLRAYGIAPPGRRDAEPALVQLRRRGAPDEAGPACPRCGSPDTRLESRFGATACKAMHTCRACGEPFEEFKPV